MRRFLAFTIFLITLYSVVFASAAALDVDGGTIQVFAHAVSIPGLGGTSLDAYKTAAGSWQPGEGGSHAVVSGEVCVTNNGEWNTQNLAITDMVQVHQGRGGYQEYTSQLVDVSGRPVLAPGETYCYPYRIAFEPVPGARYRNVALVTINNHSGWLPGSKHCPGPEPCPFGPAPKASFELPEASTCAQARLLPNGHKQAPAAPGAAGTYHWRLMNSGTCAWDGGYRIAFHGGDRLGAPQEIALLAEGQQVEPGHEIEVGVAYQAPVGAGEYQGEFRLLGSDGEAIPVEDAPQGSLWLQVVVAPLETSPTATPSPQSAALPAAAATPTAQATPTKTTSATPTNTPSAPPTSTLPVTPTPPPAFTQTPTSPPTAAGKMNCTRPAGYWLEYPQAWPATELSLGDRLVTKEQALEILREPAEEARHRLAQQVIAAKLNLAAGADGSEIDGSLEKAGEWLQDHPAGSSPAESSQKKADALAVSLEEFNLGLSGPEACPDASLQPTPTAPPEATATASPTPTATLAPSTTPTAPATGTASPTPTLPFETPTQPAPATNTEAPTPTPAASETPTPAAPTEKATSTPEPPTATALPAEPATQAAPVEAPSPTPDASETTQPASGETLSEAAEPATPAP